MSRAVHPRRSPPSSLAHQLLGGLHRGRELLLAADGAKYRREGVEAVAPRDEAMRDGTFRSFFTSGTAWGTMTANADGARVEIAKGRVPVRRIEVALPGGPRFSREFVAGTVLEAGRTYEVLP
jgi:hypothetical protein